MSESAFLQAFGIAQDAMSFQAQELRALAVSFDAVGNERVADRLRTAAKTMSIHMDELGRAYSADLRRELDGHEKTWCDILSSLVNRTERA